MKRPVPGPTGVTNDNCPSSGPCELPASLFEKRQGLGKEGDSAKTLSIVGFALGGVGFRTLTVVPNGTVSLFYGPAYRDVPLRGPAPRGAYRLFR